VISSLSHVLEVFVTLVVLVVLAWVVVLGGVGALLSYSRGSSPVEGLLFGLLGPFGWWLIWIRSDERVADGLDLEMLDDDDWSLL
jgi:hypothetical protein